MDVELLFPRLIASIVAVPILGKEPEIFKQYMSQCFSTLISGKFLTFIICG